MNKQHLSPGDRSQQSWGPPPARDSGYSSTAEPQEHDNRSTGGFTFYDPTAGDTNQVRYPHGQSKHTRDPISSETSPDHSNDLVVAEELSAEGAYGQSDHKRGHERAMIEGNVHSGGGNQYLGTRIQPGLRVNDERMLKSTANLVVRNNHFTPEGRGNQVIGQAVLGGGVPMAFSGQYQGNINEGPGHQIIGISFENWDGSDE
ncbi:hypothetical protein GGR51DRAFT_516060 [Nemania sp. FL0031]|nr:hypothetical protein GGR51DRAFT_516060 [Nemania sp. FL0031]